MKHEKNGYLSFIIYGIAFWEGTCRIEMKINNNEIKGPSKKIKRTIIINNYLFFNIQNLNILKKIEHSKYK